MTRHVVKYNSINAFINYYYYYCNRFMAPGTLSGTTRVNRYQKGRTTLDFNEARNDGMAVASAEQS